MAHLSSRTLRSFRQSSETSWTVAWKWMLRKEVEEKSCFRLERLVCTSLFLLFYLSIHHIHCRAFSLFFPSIPSWSWQSHFPVSHLSSWQPRRRWRAIASLSTELPCLPMLCTDMCQPISIFVFFVPDNWLWVTCFFGCTSLKKSPDKPHCEEDQKSSTTPSPSLHTNSCFSFRYQKTSQTKVLSVRVGRSSFVQPVSWWQVRARLVFNSEWRRCLVLFSFFFFLF